MKFDDLEFELIPSPSSGFDVFGSNPNGFKATHYFDNGYGVSIVRAPGTYGWEEGLFEAHILQQIGNQWFLCHEAAFTRNIIGHCRPKDIDRILSVVEKL